MIEISSQYNLGETYHGQFIINYLQPSFFLLLVILVCDDNLCDEI